MAVTQRSWRGRRPSYKGGYARNAGESIAPEQWRGIVCAWCASLGPTGNQIRDLSGHGFHGRINLPAIHTASELWARGPGNLLGQPFNFPGDGFRRFLVDPAPVIVDKSFMMWVRNDDGNGFETLITFGQDSPFFGFAAAKINIFSSLLGTTVITPEEWNHVAATSGPSGSVAYMNGQPDGTGTRNTQTATTLQVGWSLASTQLTGAMDDIRVYDRQLSAAEIQGIYELGPGGMFMPKRRRVFATVATPTNLTGVLTQIVFDELVKVELEF